MYGEHLYGEQIYGQEKQYEYELVKLERDLINYLPSFYHKTNHTKMMNIPDYAISRQFGYIKQLSLQRNIDKSTWGIIVWEEELGLDNKHLPIEQRKEIVKAKLRGAGRTTVKKLQNMARAFSGGEVKITQEYDKFLVKIEFVGTLGIPNNMIDFTKSIDEVIPAHLDYEFVYSFNTCDDVLSWGLTCDELLNLNITNDELMSYDFEKESRG